MKRLTVVVVLTLWLMACEAEAASAFIVAAGDLRDESATLAPTNSIAVLVVDTGNDGFTTNLVPTSPLCVGSFLTGSDNATNDQIVAVWDLSSPDTEGQLLYLTAVAYNSPIAAGQAIALYWFPSLTQASPVPGTGTHFGFYTDLVGIDDSAPWIMPGDGGGITELNFVTMSE